MSFQKAHQFSNELGEVVIAQRRNLNSSGTGSAPIASQNPLKSYRILEIGFVPCDNASSPNLKINVGKTDGGVDVVAVTSAIPVAADSKGVAYSTSSGSFDFAAAVLDADGIPRLEKGESLYFDVDTVAGGAQPAIVFARLAPLPEYKD